MDSAVICYGEAFESGNQGGPRSPLKVKFEQSGEQESKGQLKSEKASGLMETE